jgi:drug/metabolite transporter (DMT)-like permease
MTKILALVTALVGVVLAVTPWLLRFTGDRVARMDVVIGGLVVAVLGLLSYETLVSASRTQRAQH